jgi:pyruvate dehydrogenase complex dehydrogenase (E1) component
MPEAEEVVKLPTNYLELTFSEEQMLSEDALTQMVINSHLPNYENSIEMDGVVKKTYHYLLSDKSRKVFFEKLVRLCQSGLLLATACPPAELLMKDPKKKTGNISLYWSKVVPHPHSAAFREIDWEGDVAKQQGEILERYLEDTK